MKRYTLLLVAICAIAIDIPASAQKKRSATPHAPGEDIYKHYTGMVGNKQVALDLMYGYQGASNYGGSNYYSSDNNVLTTFIIQEPPSFEHNVPLNGHELPSDTSLGAYMRSDYEKMAAWNFTIAGDKLKGRWKSGDGKRNYNIELTEDYARSMPLDLFVLTDTSVARDESGKRPLKALRYVGTKPSENSKSADAEFLTNQALKFLPDNKSNDLPAYYRSYLTKYVADASGPTNLLLVNFLPVYNDLDLLVMKLEPMTFPSSGDKVQTNVQYLCLDMKSHKRLAPEDMLDISNPKLPQLLESAARKKYGLAPGIKLSAWLVRDKVIPTKNFYPGHKGFYFTYNAGELAKAKVVTLFLPYEQVEDMMPKNFRRRVE